MRDKSDSPDDHVLLRVAIGVVYFYFGFLKFYPDLSPAELMASQTVMRISPIAMDGATALKCLAVMECLIGLGFLFRVGMQWVLLVFLFHQVCTFTPLFVYPELTFKFAPFAPNMEGQYIVKNLISLAAGLTVLLPEVKSHWHFSWVRNLFVKKTSKRSSLAGTTR